MTGTQPTEHPELTASRDGVVLALHVHPGAKRPGVAGRHGDALRLRVSAPATAGRANDEVLSAVAAMFGQPRSTVRLVTGATTRHKRVLLERATLADAAAVVDRLLGEPPGQRA